MKRLEFDLGTAARSSGPGLAVAAAGRVLERHQDLARLEGVLGAWSGARASHPYIVFAVEVNAGEKLQREIPDRLEGVSVYFVEGRLALHREDDSNGTDSGLPRPG